MKCKIFTLGQEFRPLLGRPVLLLFLLLVIFFVLSLNRYVILLNEFESEFSAYTADKQYRMLLSYILMTVLPHN